MSKNIDLSVFEEVFSAHVAGCVETCECNRVFYDRVNYYDWEKGEFEALEADILNATVLDYGVELLDIDGKSYVKDCDCWHGRAIQIINWLNHNAERIGKYFRLEKKRRIAEADKLPVDIKFPFPEGFRSMVSAPKNATWIEVLMENGHIQTAHWAQDLSGECQPAFQGWFIKSGNSGFSQIDQPIAWKPIEKESKR